jgi:hypothetical protein
MNNEKLLALLNEVEEQLHRNVDVLRSASHFGPAWFSDDCLHQERATYKLLQDLREALGESTIQ